MFDVGGKTWKSYNWSMVTTLAMFGKYDAELMCHAHSKGARVVLKGIFLPLHCLFSSFAIRLKFEEDMYFMFLFPICLMATVKATSPSRTSWTKKIGRCG